MYPCHEVCSNIRDVMAILQQGYAYDWDGRGALPIRPDSCDLACALFSVPLESVVLALPECEAIVETNGTVTITFSGDRGRTLSLNFKGRLVLSYEKSWGDGEAKVEGLIHCDDPDQHATLVELLTWLGDKV